MISVGDIIGGIKSQQSEIALALARGNASTWEAYQKLTGKYQGLQDALDTIDKLLKEDDEDE